MFSTLFSIGPFALRSYGLMLAIGFLSGIMIAAKRAQKAGENPDHIYNLSVWVVISSLLGARLYYVVTHYHEFRADHASSVVNRIFIELKNMFWPVGSDGQVGISGLILYGGLILGTITAAYYFRKHKLNIPLYLDIITPSMGIGEFFTRIGCFLNGCCFGHPTDSFMGMIFPENSPAGYFYPDTHIHPTQLYNSGAALFIFAMLLFLERYKKFNGFTMLSYLMLYSIGRFSIDFLRYYGKNLRFMGFTHNQLLSMFAFTAALTLMIVLSVRAKRKTVE